jgi:Flp pilus assembly pilin Flp
MVEAERFDLLADAAGGSAAYSHAARSALKRLFRHFSDRKASTAIEYAMVAAGIAVLVVTAVNTLGQNVYHTFFSQIANDL